MLDRWDKRYSEKEYAYGKQPNAYLKSVLDKMKPGKILFPCEGEGRNAVYAAELGWEVYAFDYSKEGKMKAEELAKERGVEINYRVGEFESLDYEVETFDALALIYAHFQADKKPAYHDKLNRYLKKGGLLLLEAFSKNHIPYKIKNPGVGGPDDIDMLYSKEEILLSHSTYENLALEETIIFLEEGKYHRGEGSVIRFQGLKL